MLDHWEVNGPPVYVAVASYLGMIKPRGKKGSGKPATKSGAGDLNDLAKMFSANGGNF